MRSKFKYTAYLVGLLAIVFSFLLIGVFSRNALNPNMPLGFFLIACMFFLFVWIWIFFGEVRTKAIAVNLEYDSLTVKRYLGLGIPKVYNLDKITGFKVSILSSRSGSYEYLYLIVGDRKIVKLSEFYHSNYKGLKSYIIAMEIKNLGFERFSNRQELKDIFMS
jgi:hypothetical protein